MCWSTSRYNIYFTAVVKSLQRFVCCLTEAVPFWLLGLIDIVADLSASKDEGRTDEMKWQGFGEMLQDSLP